VSLILFGSAACTLMVCRILPGGIEVNEVVVLKNAEAGRILQCIIEKKIQANMCYLSRGKWHIAKILPIKADDNGLAASVLSAHPDASGLISDGARQSPEFRPRPVNIHIGQSAGLALKYEGGKFIFETKVTDFEFSPDSTGGVIMLETPEQIELISRRSFYRVHVPDKLDVEVAVWHRCFRQDSQPEKIWRGRLIDLSAGGLQLAIPALQKPDFSEGQFAQVAFAPLPSEANLEFSAQIRNILPTADGLCVCHGMQMVGLEASKEGRLTLTRLAAVTELYYELNRTNEYDRCPQVGVKTKTCVRHFRPDWGCLQNQSE
jgi:hypothetical protein